MSNFIIQDQLNPATSLPVVPIRMSQYNFGIRGSGANYWLARMRNGGVGSTPNNPLVSAANGIYPDPAGDTYQDFEVMLLNNGQQTVLRTADTHVWQFYYHFDAVAGYDFTLFFPFQSQGSPNFMSQPGLVISHDSVLGKVAYLTNIESNLSDSQVLALGNPTDIVIRLVMVYGQIQVQIADVAAEGTDFAFVPGLRYNHGTMQIGSRIKIVGRFSNPAKNNRIYDIKYGYDLPYYATKELDWRYNDMWGWNTQMTLREYEINTGAPNLEPSGGAVGQQIIQVQKPAEWVDGDGEKFKDLWCFVQTGVYPMYYRQPPVNLYIKPRSQVLLKVDLTTDSLFLRALGGETTLIFCEKPGLFQHLSNYL